VKKGNLVVVRNGDMEAVKKGNPAAVRKEDMEAVKNGGDMETVNSLKESSKIMIIFMISINDNISISYQYTQCLRISCLP